MMAMGTVKFQLGDIVHKDGDRIEVFVVIALRQFEPCCQIQSEVDPSSKQWAISQDLELVSRPGDARSKGTTAGQ
jgi:hypothetical protein